MRKPLITAALLPLLTVLLTAGCSYDASKALENSKYGTGLVQIKNFQASAGNESVSLTWSEQDEKYFEYIELTYSSIYGTVNLPEISQGLETYDVTGLMNGVEYTFTIAEVDSIGNRSERNSVKATPIDPTEKTAVLSNTPANPTNQTSINISVSGDDVSYYSYNLDSAGWSDPEAVSTPINKTSLSEGAHSLEVLAKSSSGVWQTTATTFTWTIDSSEKIAALSGTPPFNSMLSTISITVGGDDIVSFICKIDGGLWSAETLISSPITASGLGAGPHTIEVLGKTSSGTWQSSSNPTTYTWNIIKSLSITGIVSTIAGKAQSYTNTYADGIGTNALFRFPAQSVIVGNYMYIADSGNYLIRKMDLSTYEVTTFAGTPKNLTPGGWGGCVDGVGTNAMFYNPSGITTDGTYLYVADKYNYCIRKIEISTATVSTMAGKAGTFGSTDGIGTNALFYEITGITTDGTNLYVCDTRNQTIRKINIATTEVTTIAGIVNTIGYLDGLGSSAKFNYPSGITTDNTSLFISDSWNNVIRKIDIATNQVSTLAGSTTSGYVNAVGTAARFSCPRGLLCDGSNLYICDAGNNVIRKLYLPTLTVSFLAGKSGTSGSTDGTGSAASFYTPYSITTDGAYLYVSDYNNYTIRKIE